MCDEKSIRRGRTEINPSKPSRSRDERDRYQKAEVGCRKPEGKGRTAEARSQMSEYSALWESARRERERMTGSG
jgi:hypothetical protein